MFLGFCSTRPDPSRDLEILEFVTEQTPEVFPVLFYTTSSKLYVRKF
jgi:hypothetical protein